jgi:hypothetical protein
MPLVAIILGIYLLSVVYQGNANAFVSAVKNSGGFVKWVAALSVLGWLAGSKTFGAATKPLLGMALVGLALSTYPNIQREFSTFWNEKRI